LAIVFKANSRCGNLRHDPRSIAWPEGFDRSGGDLVLCRCLGQDADPSPIFARDVAPIISKNCTVCHRPGQSAPFGLLSYRDAMRRAKQIVQVTGSRYMAPWAGACSSKTILMPPSSTWAKRCN